ncbi:MAG: hypothetical protein ACLFTE_10855 [Salinivenus sp.]
MFGRLRLASWLLLALSGAVLVGCGSADAPVDVEEGQFVAEIAGGVTDTLSGPVHYRMRDGELVGLELGAQDGPGLSIELEPRPLSSSTYEVVEDELFGVEHKRAPARALAFLTKGDAEFTARRGSVTVERGQGETVTATFSFEMAGRLSRGGGDAGVLVDGQLHALPLRE